MFVQEAGLAPAWLGLPVPAPDRAMSIYRLSSRFERFHHSCSFVISNTSKNFFQFRFLRTFPYCIEIYGLIPVFPIKFSPF